MLRKSKHFNQRWREEMGGRPPSEAEIEGLLAQCVLTQRYRECLTIRGRPFTILALYWHPDRKLVFKINERRDEIVTVLTEHTLKNKYRNRGGNHGVD